MGQGGKGGGDKEKEADRQNGTGRPGFEPSSLSVSKSAAPQLIAHYVIGVGRALTLDHLLFQPGLTERAGEKEEKEKEKGPTGAALNKREEGHALHTGKLCPRRLVAGQPSSGRS